MSFNRLKGLAKEKLYSQVYHQAYPALLVSPLVIRDYGLGQIDLAFFESKNDIKILEVKSSQRPQYSQIKRLARATNYISQVLNKNVSLYLTI